MSHRFKKTTKNMVFIKKFILCNRYRYSPNVCFFTLFLKSHAVRMCVTR